MTLLNSHKQTNHDELRYPCDICEYSAPNLTHLKRHNEAQHNGIVFPCDQCPYEAATKGTLKKHMMKHGTVKLQCDQCSHKAVLLSDLIAHKKAVHEGKRDHVCHMCGESFTKKFMLQDHLALKHGIGEVRFKCDFCGKGFLTGARRQDHIDGTHLKNKQFKCDRCPHVCYTKKALYKHQNYGRCHQEKNMAMLHKM